MKFYLAKDENGLHPNWFAVQVKENDRGYGKIAVEEYLKTRDAKRNKAVVVECEITEL